MKYALFFIVLFLALGPAAGATSYLVLPDGSGDFPTVPCQTEWDSYKS